MWFIKQRIIFELFIPYSQEENGVSERTGKMIIDMMKVILYKGGIDDTLCPKIVLVMTYIKNLSLMQVFGEFISLIEMQNYVG